MAQSKKPRRKYRPRAVNNLAHLLPIMGSKRMSEDEQKKRTVPVDLAVERIVSSAGSRSDWTTVFDCVNFIDAFSKMPSVMQGAEDFVMRCMGTMDAVMTRFRGTDTRELAADEADALRDLRSLWADVLDRVTWRQFIDAEALVTVTVARALAGDVPPGVRVVEPPAVLEVRA